MLGAPVFAKGYLKKYAQLVHIKAEDVLADYYRLNRAAEAPPVVSSRQRPRQELSPGPWITVIVVIVLIVTAYVWFARPEAPDVPLTDSVAEEDTTSVSPPVARILCMAWAVFTGRVLFSTMILSAAG